MLTSFVEEKIALNYLNARKNHWDASIEVAPPLKGARAFYHEQLANMYAFLISPGQRVLEIGCAKGALLRATEPKEGTGVDFSPRMISLAQSSCPDYTFVEADAHDLSPLKSKEALSAPYDAVILSDLINDVFDLSAVFAELKPFCKAETRIVANFHSQLWEAPFSVAQAAKWMQKRLPQNWFTVDDVKNIAELNDFQCVQHFDAFLWPWKTPLISSLLNKYLAHIWPFSMGAMTHFVVFRPTFFFREAEKVSIVIPARNEAGNIRSALERTPEMGKGTEIIFVEGNSTDNTWHTIQETVKDFPQRDIKIMQQPGKGKGDAVRTGFAAATGEILMILDADLTMPPEALPQFYDAISSGKAEFVNGVRLVYPQEEKAMRFFNLVGNKFFSLAFSWLLGRPIKDTLCGTKVLRKEAYERIADNRAYFGNFDPFGDFDLLFGAAKQNLLIRDLPVRYQERVYGDTNINRWRDGCILLRMVLFAARRIKFIG